MTGGRFRIKKGIDLLSQKKIDKLIISGVHPSASLFDIFPQLPFYGYITNEQIVFDRTSKTTYGNAIQSLPLLEALGCRDFLLITSVYHMYRASNTFQALLTKDIKMELYAVPPYPFTNSRVELFNEVIKSFFYSLWAY